MAAGSRSSQREDDHRVGHPRIGRRLTLFFAYVEKRRHAVIAARVTVARIESPYRTRKDKGLGVALVPGLPVDRFNRTWRLEVDRNVMRTLRASERIPSQVRGRLGFDKVTGEAPAWNEDLGQFVPLPQHDGGVVPFLIRTSDLSVAFQRTSKIKRQSFIGALQKLLREGSGNDNWLVRDWATERSWEEFRATAVRVTEVTIIVMPTNPGWAGQKLFQPYIDELGGEKAKITVTGDDLDLDSTPIEQAKTHAIERGYGELEAKGITSTGAAVRFDSDDTVPVIDSSVERGREGEVPYEALQETLERLDELE